MSTGEPVTRKQRQRQRTRRLLLDAGRGVIAAKGVPGLRIQEVTERADVALGSFYNYFTSKEELVDAIVTEMLAELASTAIRDDSPDSDPAESAARATLRVVHLAFADPEFAKLISNIGHSEVVFARALHPYAAVAVQRGIDSGRFVVPDIEVLLTSVIGAALALMREILDGRHGLSAEVAFVRHVVAALGVSPAEAEVIAEKVRDEEGR
ncbi:TetR/AcrR family transcriptional regulator [Mycolicibacterium sp. A43C]